MARSIFDQLRLVIVSFAWLTQTSDHQINYCEGSNLRNFLEEIEIPVSDFIISALTKESRVDIMWTRSLPPTTRARAYAINSVEDFNSRISNSYLPWYKNGKGPYDSDAENYTVRKKTTTLTGKELNDYEHRLSSGVLITIACHTGLDARLIVDGCKRACAIQNKINGGFKFPSLQVIECYGPDVASSFATDFNHIIRNLSRIK